MLMPLNLPSKADRSTKEQVLFELGLPSLAEISRNKRRKLNFERGQEINFVCELEDKSQFDQLDDNDSPNEGKNGSKRMWKGRLAYPIVGETTLRPSTVADFDKRGLTEEQIKKKLTSADEKRAAITTENLVDPIMPPGQISFGDDND